MTLEDTTLEESTLTDKWPQIGDILKNHSGGRPDPTQELAGQTFTLTPDGGAALQLYFVDGATLELQYAGGRHVAVQPCQVFNIRGGRFFIDYVDVDNSGLSVSIWLDPAARAALLVESDVSDRSTAQLDLLSRVAQSGSQSVPVLRYTPASLDGGAAPVFGGADAILGKYFRYIYSDTHVYDHFYINAAYYFWYCWHGPDAGLGDYDQADYLELADDIYLVCWREKFIPCVGVTIEDHAEMQSIGKVFGADSRTWETANSTVGARMVEIAAIPAPPAPAAS